MKTLSTLRPSFISLLELLVGSILIIAGVAKLFDLHSFHDSLLNLPMLGGTGAGLVTILIPNIEVTLGICLALGYQTAPIRGATCALSLSFTLVALFWVAHGMQTKCACLGPIQLPPEAPVMILARNLLLTLTTAYIYYYRGSEGYSLIATSNKTILD